jgi:putative addiction module component (TIGR02574 family)
LIDYKPWEVKMDTKSKSLLEAALELPESERAEIAAELLATLGPDDTLVSDEELSNELERRLEECRHEPSSTISWSLLKGER